MRRSRWLTIIAVVAVTASVLMASGGSRRVRARTADPSRALAAVGAPAAAAFVAPVPALAAADRPVGFVGVVVAGGDRLADVRFAVPQRDGAAVAVGRTVAVRTPDGVLLARVERIAREVEPASRTFVADARPVDAAGAACARRCLAAGAMVRVTEAAP